MKKNELIEKIEVLMRDNSGITFDTPEEIAGEELLSISYCGELSFTSVCFIVPLLCILLNMLCIRPRILRSGHPGTWRNP